MVYHYDKTGEREIYDFKSRPVEDEGEAIDDAAEWAEANDLNAEME